MAFSFKSLFQSQEVESENPNKEQIELLEKTVLTLGDRVYQLETVVKMLLLAQTQMNEDVGVLFQTLKGNSGLEKHLLRFGADDDDGGLIN
tara:strand:+ start:207 stop:479 length:273 start_codon:yes stop_codon:yes gene_type:complete